jgi:hypothetical protein
MARQKGCKKYGGRKAGTPNKSTQGLANYLDERGFFLPDKIIDTFDLLTPEKRVDLLLKLMEYVYPKRKSVEIKAEIGEISSIAELVNSHS